MSTATLTPLADEVAAQAALGHARRMYRQFADRASRVWVLVQRARAVSLPVPQTLVLSTVAHAIYFSNRYDACEQYESVEDFQEALAEDWRENPPFESSVQGGVPVYCIRPVFSAGQEYLTQLGLNYLTGYCTYKNLAELDVAVPPEAGLGVPAGVSFAEIEVLVRDYERRTLRLVNLLRELETSLHYFTSGLRDWQGRADAGAAWRATTGFKLDLPWDDTLARIVQEMAPLVTLGLTPAPAKHFGTDADRINPLRQLPPGLGTD